MTWRGWPKRQKVYNAVYNILADANRMHLRESRRYDSYPLSKYSTAKGSNANGSEVM